VPATDNTGGLTGDPGLMGLIAQALQQSVVHQPKESYWIFANSAGKHVSGSRVPGHRAVVGLSLKGVVSLEDGDEVFVRKFTPSVYDKDKILNDRIIELESERADGRVLPITRDLLGARY
jgi:hypothetical protein